MKDNNRRMTCSGRGSKVKQERAFEKSGKCAGGRCLCGNHINNSWRMVLDHDSRHSNRHDLPCSLYGSSGGNLHTFQLTSSTDQYCQTIAVWQNATLSRRRDSFMEASYRLLSFLRCSRIVHECHPYSNAYSSSYPRTIVLF